MAINEHSLHDNSPILITGTFRSGTTLLAQVFNSHSNISITYDTIKFLRFSYDKFNPINDTTNIISLLNEIKERIYKRHKMILDVDTCMHEITAFNQISYAHIYNTVMNNANFIDINSTIWGEKVNLAWTKIPDFFSMFPIGRVLHIIRDPRSVIASWKKYTHAPGNDYLDMVFNCYDSMNIIDTYQLSFSTKKYIAIKFEDFLNDPEYTTKSICCKFDIPYEPDMIDIDNFTDRSGNQWKGNSMFTNTFSNIDTAPISYWKSKLEQWEVAFIEFFLKDIMVRHNYIPSINSFSATLLDKIFDNTIESLLVSQSALKFLITGKGVEQFPLNPSDPMSWDTILK